MDRFISLKLLEWKDKFYRKPIILRGARQVGETGLVLDFGNYYFDGKGIHKVVPQ